MIFNLLRASLIFSGVMCSALDINSDAPASPYTITLSKGGIRLEVEVSKAVELEVGKPGTVIGYVKSFGGGRVFIPQEISVTELLLDESVGLINQRVRALSVKWPAVPQGYNLHVLTGGGKVQAESPLNIYFGPAITRALADAVGARKGAFEEIEALATIEGAAYIVGGEEPVEILMKIPLRIKLKHPAVGQK